MNKFILKRDVNDSKSFHTRLSVKRCKADCIWGIVLLYFLLGFVLNLGMCFSNLPAKSIKVAYSPGNYIDRERALMASITSRSYVNREYVSAELLDNGIQKASQKEIYKLNNTIPHTKEERSMMEYIVECEAHGLSKYHKAIIASVIVNRRYSSYWKYESLKSVMLADNQFSSLDNWYDKTQAPNKDTKLAVKEVLYGTVNREVISKGAVFFYNPDVCGTMSYFEEHEYLFSLDGHKFFR